MYVVTGVEFIFSISLLISSVKIRNWKMSLLAGFPYIDILYIRENPENPVVSITLSFRKISWTKLNES